MFAAPGAVAALGELTRGRHVSIVRRRLNQFLAEPQPDECTDRYQLFFDRLDKAVGVPDVEETGYMQFERLRSLLRRRNLANPLADVRGAAGRTRALAAAIRTGLANHEDAGSIEVRIRAAEAAGLPLTLW
jgi:hypothetical protein